MKFDKIPQYELLMQETISDIHSEGYLLRHKKSGARILVLENEDNNKVFNIAFRTTPTNSTGVAHIMEHSVLCGSKLFPSKDPFVELVKGSLNTFLNAMTYPDKTMYPVASCNDKDFCNLMHVYLDAVFYPNIYKKEEIFRQEGWSYQLESEDDTLVLNGVVYNEMKGVYSSPEDVLEREVMNSLFPDTTYGVESGGDPENIPDLTYEEFLDFHRKYYHPSNSYIYLYGKMNMEERLNWMDQEYLSAFDKKEVSSDIQMQEPFEQLHEIHKTYPVSESDELEENTYLAYNAVVGTSLDGELANAFAVLEYALLSAPGAVLKQKLLDEGLGKDIMSSYDSGIQQPYISIIAKNAKKEDASRFLTVIRETLKQTIKEGIDRKALLAGLNTMEFKFREADYGSYPKGLMYGLDVFDSWLYDENAPFTYLKQLNVYKSLRERVNTGYFEKLVQKYLLDNTHASLLVAEPEQGLTAKKEAAMTEKLQKFRASLSKDEIEKLIQKTKQLRVFQESPSTPEELEKIPMLAREDIGKDSVPFQNQEIVWDGTTIVHHDVNTNGIAYLDLLFDIHGVNPEDYPYLGLLKAILGMMNTENYSYQDLNNEINMNTGGVAAGISVYPDLKKENQIRAFVGMRCRVLYDKIPFALEMVEEILLRTTLEDDKRMHEILSKLQSRLSMQLASAGHSTAAGRALSYLSQMNAFNDAISGITFYQLIEDLEKNYEEKKDYIRAKIRELIAVLFTRKNLLISMTSDKNGLELLKNPLMKLQEKLSDVFVKTYPIALPLAKKNEAFMTPGQVQYVARTGNFRSAGFEYTGLLRIVKVMMSYDYLWTNVRVMGGAYGCMSSFGRTGDSYFVSYRDPHLRKTNEVYEKIPAYLEEFEADEHEMTKYIIGTISELDTPLTASMKGRRSMNAYLSGITFEEVQKERDEILNATVGEIRSIAPMIRAILDWNALCVIGNEEKIRKEQDLFDSIQMLTNS